MRFVLGSSKQFLVQGHPACRLRHVNFMRIQMCKFKVYHINPPVQRGSFLENICSLITIKQIDIQAK